eukprot:g29649.t1
MSLTLPLLTPSSWTPSQGLLPSLELFISNCRREINCRNLSTTLTHSNLSPTERAALHSFRFNPNLTIKPADKGVVVWHSGLYIAKARRLLSDTSSYRSLDHDPTSDNQNIISQTTYNIITSGDLPPTASNLIVPQPCTTYFYLLPKIHKPNCPIQELPTYVRDTTHALHLLQNLRFPGPQHLIFTMDDQSLSTCIPHADSLKAVCFFLSRRPDQFPSTNTLIHLIELVLTFNNFSFNSSHLLQMKGVTMGTGMGPSYACLFVGHMEQSLFSSYTGTTPHLFLCYIDNSHKDLEQFIHFTNTFQPNLKFTWTISDTSFSFLDLSV